jgi:hypothetical protein
LGEGHEHVVGATGVGINTITATLACNTAMSIAQLIANAPNTVATAAGPVVHSLGRAPSVVWPVQLARGAALTDLGAVVNYQYVTADNSAVYVFAKTWTGALVGVATQFYVMP